MITDEMKGPFIYENWKKFLAEEALQLVAEYPLYTDAHITGEIREGYGPYQLLNTVPIPPDEGVLNPTIILRIETYLDSSEQVGMENTDTTRYHGGLLRDEIAALVSLCMGVRIRAGSVSRYFEPDGDPRGRPKGPITSENPILVKGSSSRNLILPNALGTHNLENTNLIQYLPLLTQEDAIALIRAARLYQDALWIVESEPELAWIMFVSAVEIAANHWHRNEYDSLEVFREFRPELTKAIENSCNPQTVQQIVDEFLPYLRSSKKFRDFIINFLPGPPISRPKKFAQISWKKRDLKQAMVQIYDYRSRALHDGTPFPYPMCEAPRMGEEKLPALATRAYGGTWLAKDTPMLLHVFEYIIRNVLLEWWKALVPKDTG